MSGPVEIAEVFLYDDAGGGALQVIRQSDGDFFGENWEKCGMLHFFQL